MAWSTNGSLRRVEGSTERFNAASLVKPVLADLALVTLDDLDEPVHDEITVRHVLSHTTGLPNWRPEGKPLRASRPPGQRWGYSGEGFVLLLRFLERRLGAPVRHLTDREVFQPLGMTQSSVGGPEPGYHGYCPLLTTARDYALFLAHVLGLDDERWRPQWLIDDELAWGPAGDSNSEHEPTDGSGARMTTRTTSSSVAPRLATASSC